MGTVILEVDKVDLGRVLQLPDGADVVAVANGPGIVTITVDVRTRPAGPSPVHRIRSWWFSETPQDLRRRIATLFAMPDEIISGDQDEAAHRRRRESDARLFAGLGIADPFQDLSAAPLPTQAESLAMAEEQLEQRAQAELARAAAQRPEPTRASEAAEHMPTYGESVLAQAERALRQQRQLTEAARDQAVQRQPSGTYHDARTGRLTQHPPRRQVPIIDLTPPPPPAEFGAFRVLDIREEPYEEIKPTAEEPFEEPQTLLTAAQVACFQRQSPGGMPEAVTASQAQIAAARRTMAENLNDPALREVLDFFAQLRPEQYQEAQRQLNLPTIDQVAAMVAASREIIDDMPESLPLAQVRASYGLTEACRDGTYNIPRPRSPRQEFSHYTPPIYDVHGQPELRDANTGIFSAAEVFAADRGVVQRRNMAWTVISLLERSADLPNLEMLNRVRIDDDSLPADVTCRWCNRVSRWDGRAQHCTSCGGSL